MTHPAANRVSNLATINTYDPARSPNGSYTPQEWAAVRPVFLELLRPLAGLPGATVKGAPMTATAGLLVWALRQGLPLEITLLLRQVTIDAYIASISTSPATYRSSLRRLVPLHELALEETLSQYARPAKTAPYNEAEVQALLTFAENITLPIRSRVLTGAVLLGAACGIINGELRGLAAQHVLIHDGVQHVHVAGRCVPVLERYRTLFEAYVAQYPASVFVTDSVNRNVTQKLPTWVQDAAGVPAFSSYRLRSHFICAHLELGTGARDLMRLCGVKSLDALDDYLKYLTPHAPGCQSPGAQA